ncbi:MAG: ABC transporter ATP-binding protein [Oscillospiraceae bacterium]|nr:ABC transporter ATP-binding protein [Oscillospiraceae bacterium]
MSLLSIKNLSVSYGPVTALTDVSIEVPEGKIISIIGSNGAGKTTLLNAISSVVKAQSGDILFKGIPVPKQPHNVVRAGIAQVPEGRKIFAGLSVEENLIIGSPQGGKGLKAKEAGIYELFPILGERKNQQGGTLSGGEQQMLAIARAMMSDPALIMFDEPSLGLAPVVTKQVFKYIKRISEQNVTVLLIEQNARQALGLSDYTYVLENGVVATQGDSKDLLVDPSIQKAYLGD